MIYGYVPRYPTSYPFVSICLSAYPSILPFLAYLFLAACAKSGGKRGYQLGRGLVLVLDGWMDARQGGGG